MPSSRDNRRFTVSPLPVPIFTPTGFVVCALAAAGMLAAATLPGFREAAPWLTSVAAALVFLPLAVCTVRRRRSFRPAALGLHLGITLMAMAGILSSQRRVLAVNVHQESAQEVSFPGEAAGIRLRVGEIRTIYFPVKLRIGVKKEGRKFRLVETRSGEGFSLPGCRVRLGDFLPWLAAVEIETRDEQGRLLWRGSTPTPAAGPYSFVLVAYQTPVPRSVEVDISLERNGKKLAAATIGPNRGCRWHGWQIHCTAVRRDQYGYPYASIQMCRDPGLPLFFTGALLTLAGAAFLSWPRRAGKG